MYGHSKSSWRKASDRTKRDPGLLSGSHIGLPDWCALASAHTRMETAAEKKAIETAKTVKGEQKAKAV
jgi:hypothetical protein